MNRFYSPYFLLLDANEFLIGILSKNQEFLVEFKQILLLMTELCLKFSIFDREFVLFLFSICDIALEQFLFLIILNDK